MRLLVADSERIRVHRLRTVREAGTVKGRVVGIAHDWAKGSARVPVGRGAM